MKTGRPQRIFIAARNSEGWTTEGSKETEEANKADEPRPETNGTIEPTKGVRDAVSNHESTASERICRASSGGRLGVRER